ncbi:hypothetical protein PIB30_037813 [Stylosanthes scabra]|uniref:Uncharacterized protein n=1 Tax=Stylosanthes scabra TaxID=79078 RepID=A0ABU6QDE7_9FABA|nr:hypothetical protein [Stylosanthes scabra]
MEMELSSRETDKTAGDVETRISTEKNYEGREHVAQCTTKVRNSKIGAESKKTEVVGEDSESRSRVGLRWVNSNKNQSRPLIAGSI